MRLGFIGTGKIASSVITGICNSKISFKKILVSPRNRNAAQRLKRKFKKVSIATNNQEIVNACNWVLISFACWPTTGLSSAFNCPIPPKTFDSWVLDETTWDWKAPVEYPSDGKDYTWNEETTNWDLIDE